MKPNSSVFLDKAIPALFFSKKKSRFQPFLENGSPNETIFFLFHAV